jgi:hypothetical protein
MTNYPGGMRGGVPKFNAENRAFVEESNRPHTAGPWTVTVVSHGKERAGLWINGGRGTVVDTDAYDVYPLSRQDRNLIEAAPELLAALYAIRDGFADGSIQFTKKRQADNDPYHKANTMMCAAIDKAEHGATE